MAASSEAQEELVRKWLIDNSQGSSVSKDTSVTNRLNIEGRFGKFYIIPPENNDDTWTVWSDDSTIAQTISAHIDSFLLTQQTVIDVLSKTITILTSFSARDHSSDSDSSDGDSEGEGEEEDGMYDYYELEEDKDADDEIVVSKDKNDEGVSADDFFTGGGSPAAVHRLLADFKNMSKSNGKFGITGSPRGDNLFIWDVQLSDFDPKSLLYKDLETFAARHNRKPVIDIEMKFPHDYPMTPPFVRVLRPRFQFLTGHVTIGGSICMQMLTRSGWSPSNDIESILVQVRAEIMSDPKARLDLSHTGSDYGESEARSAFERMVLRYGWNK